ncbi:radical SAM/SPASM domain-containing protein [Parabacteroides chinchillae]|uniref:Radical SAM core domain-containing protein n=1 Tax=Parabacteroides chinchillae TaxID=871327 RepID=A0A8G2FC35_9BACT|nr:radical SAM protein [Parabacteroides chinchillae]SEG22835.1 uncharacterized protein SAMN05444001_1224 [Parabacteroides chinchillae]
MNDKVSRYNIEIEYPEGTILYNTLSDTLLPIEAKEYAVIETLMEHLPTFQEKYPDLYAAFQQSGFILQSDFDELAYLKLQNRRSVYMNRNYHLTINPTLDCNLKCWYCSVDYAGTKHDKNRMSDEVVDHLLKHIHWLVTKHKSNSILLDWFGGEPLMYFNEIIKSVSDFALPLAQQYQVDFKQQITTNATLLDENKIKYMKEAKFNFIQISIDGNEQRQNLIKCYANKRGTYRDVMNNINLLTELIPDIAICLRINYDRQTLKDIKDIINDFTENSRKCIMIDFQKVWQVSCTNETHKLLKETRDLFTKSGFRSRIWTYTPFRYKCCYADSINHYVINYNGEIFKCTARDYNEKLMIGNLQNDGLISWNDGIISKMFAKATFENECCEKCRILPLCMGPCIQKNYEALINNNQPTCIYDNPEYYLSSYVLENAKNRNLI